MWAVIPIYTGYLIARKIINHLEKTYEKPQLLPTPEPTALSTDSKKQTNPYPNPDKKARTVKKSIKKDQVDPKIKNLTQQFIGLDPEVFVVEVNGCEWNIIPITDLPKFREIYDLANRYGEINGKQFTSDPYDWDSGEYELNRLYWKALGINSPSAQYYEDVHGISPFRYDAEFFLMNEGPRSSELR